MTNLNEVRKFLPPSRRRIIERLEPRHACASAWQNPGQALDVNDDLLVDKRDVDLLNANQRLMSKPLAARGPADPYFDTTGDGKFDWNDYFAVNNAVLQKTPAVAAKVTAGLSPGVMSAASVISGKVSNWASTLRLQGRVDGANWVDVTSSVVAGSFTLAAGVLGTLAGEPIYAGGHLLELQIVKGTAKTGLAMDLPFEAASDAFPAPPDRSIVTQFPWTSNRAPGVTIDFQAASTRQSVGSPSIAILPNGTYVASHDIFGTGSTGDTTRVFLSRDQGKTWVFGATLRGQFFSQLFVQDGQLYLFGTDKDGGNVVIRRSSDGGVTWTAPTSATTGKLLTGKFGTAPTPVVVSGGRIWRSMEAVTAGAWGLNYRPFVMSAPLGADLLRADSWTSSNQIVPNATWLNRAFGGFLEGNIVPAPDGGIVNILRVQTTTYPEKAAIVRVSADGKVATFNPAQDFIAFPGGAKKFTIRYDEVTQRYWALVNDVPLSLQTAANQPAKTRNTLSLISSANLRDWTVERLVLQNPDVARVGFQYADFAFSGADLVVTVRVAYREPSGALAPNYHDANYLTFLRVTDFRDRLI